MLEKPGRLRNLALPCAPKETSGGQVEVIFWRASPSRMVAEEPNYNGLMVIKTIKTIEKKNNFINLFHQKKGLQVYPLINIEQNYGRSMVSPFKLA